MIATSNAVFIGRRSYDKKLDNAGMVETKYIYDFVVFDSEEVNGLKNPRIMSMILPCRCEVAENLIPLTRCLVDLEVKVYSSKTIMEITDVRERI